MNANGIGLSIKNCPIQFSDFEISWVGENPLAPGFCFGSEDGRIKFSNVNMTEDTIYQAAESRETINGIAFMDGIIGREYS